MKKLAGICLFIFAVMPVLAQAPQSLHSSEILLRMKKLNVLGSVLYIAAHPDDENTRLLGYLANEKLYRTGYLSLTRGDGGQNLIGNEQGIDLGLIRTQELLAARRTDGAEQFFTSAYDFGYSKNPEEALRTWNHDKILAEVVWMIRRFRPDIIIARFPVTGEGGHGHHTASAILAGEAFDAASDPAKFPEQLKQGLSTWKASRLLWNTFNFGNTNTQREDQFKLDVGQFNPLLGKSYGEIAAISRSQHRSQGFGVPSQRGSINEYFSTIRGTAPVNDLMDGNNLNWQKVGAGHISNKVQQIVQEYDIQHPEKSVGPLLQLLAALRKLPADDHWVKLKSNEVTSLIEACSGLYIEAVTDRQLLAIGDSATITLQVNNRLGADLKKISVTVLGKDWFSDSLLANQNRSHTFKCLVPADHKPSQPYWLERGLHNGSFTIDDPALTGLAQNENMEFSYRVSAGDESWTSVRPVRYKFTDPVRGERYEPVQIIQPVLINASPSLVIFKNEDKNVVKNIRFSVQSKISLPGPVYMEAYNGQKDFALPAIDSGMKRMEKRIVAFNLNSELLEQNSRNLFSARLTTALLKNKQYHALRKIAYDHIPELYYHFVDQVTVLRFDLKTAGKKIGYIAGAGDRVSEALEQMGYEVINLKESDLEMPSLKQFDAIVTGVRAYNIHEWLSGRYEALMEYVQQGGVMLTQYNTNNSIGPLKARIAPYPFTIGRTRVTDEHAEVRFTDPADPLLNYPNKIGAADFESWVQERSVYHAENIDNRYKRIILMNDPGDKEQDGSLIYTEYGKGRFIYTGLSLFRQLPAGISGAYRLLANLLAPPIMK